MNRFVYAAILSAIATLCLAGCQQRQEQKRPGVLNATQRSLDQEQLMRDFGGMSWAQRANGMLAVGGTRVKCSTNKMIIPVNECINTVELSFNSTKDGALNFVQLADENEASTYAWCTTIFPPEGKALETPMAICQKPEAKDVQIFQMLPNLSREWRFVTTAQWTPTPAKAN
jgi:hypothetical protein